MHQLSSDDFSHIVKNAPLVSIDLIIENNQGEILLGWRNNSPAKGYWFVPGGRILKNEHFDKAFERIAKAETGSILRLENAIFLGVYEHIYPEENFSGKNDFGTHYIVLAFRLRPDDLSLKLQHEQHADYWWASLDEILKDPNVHENTRNYFNGHPPFSG